MSFKYNNLNLSPKRSQFGLAFEIMDLLLSIPRKIEWNNAVWG